MRGLTLRSRLLLAVGFTTLVQVAAAGVLISYTSDQLLDQIDERLEAAVGVAANGDFSAIGDVYHGVVSPNHEVTTRNALIDRGSALPPPAVSKSNLAASLGGPVTVDAQTGRVDYRLVAQSTADGNTLIVASPLTGYIFTTRRLTRLVILTSGIVTAVLAAVSWWVLRAGITPIKRMTSAADDIAAGDLTQRLETPEPHTEAGQLGLALNTMLGRIETSFEQQSRAEARLREFIADASHELRTPVATIRGYAELYEAGGLGEGAELDDAMRRTSEESRRMSRLINDMLQLAKLDHSPALRTETVDLCQVARDVAADAALTSPGRRIDLDNQTVPALVYGDGDLIRQAVTNLVSNALLHTSSASAVSVSVRSDASSATLSVVDDGDGMPPEVVSRVTERFYRADASRDRQRGGSGLGLAIVASIAEAHKADLHISSAIGHGTTVTITMQSADELDALG